MEKDESLFPPKQIWLGNEFGCPPFDKLNKMLYTAVEESPSNIDCPQIIGKLTLIGRTYSASVERRRTNGTVKDERQALEVIITASKAIAESRVEIMLSEIAREERLTSDCIQHVVAIHREICSALNFANGRENSSLASKYLHFHRPHLFPIVDSYVREGWSWVMEAMNKSYSGWRQLGKVERYKDWCEHIIDLQLSIERYLKLPVSLRQVDNYLLSILSLDGQGGWGLPRLPESN